MQIVTSANDVARATYNALRVCPKEGPLAMCMLVLESGSVSYLTFNYYALSWASHEASTPDLAAEGVAYKVSYEDMNALEKRAREGKKERVYLDFRPEDKTIWYRGEDSDKDLRMDDIFEDGMDDDSWDEINLAAFRNLISERENDPQARKVLVNPDYFRYLAMAKKLDKAQGAHLYFGANEDDVVLIKVGSELKYLIEPIDPERHAAALGEDAVW